MCRTQIVLNILLMQLSAQAMLGLTRMQIYTVLSEAEAGPRAGFFSGALRVSSICLGEGACSTGAFVWRCER